jgi:hypothetical protein
MELTVLKNGGVYGCSGTKILLAEPVNLIIQIPADAEGRPYSLSMVESLSGSSLVNFGSCRVATVRHVGTLLGVIFDAAHHSNRLRLGADPADCGWRRR